VVRWPLVLGDPFNHAGIQHIFRYSPEGCASILWKSADKSQLAAEAMGITSDRIREQGFLDEVVREPLGGGHRNFREYRLNLKESIESSFRRANASRYG